MHPEIIADNRGMEGAHPHKGPHCSHTARTQNLLCEPLLMEPYARKGDPLPDHKDPDVSDDKNSKPTGRRNNPPEVSPPLSCALIPTLPPPISEPMTFRRVTSNKERPRKSGISPVLFYQSWQTTNMAARGRYPAPQSPEWEGVMPHYITGQI